MNFLRKLSFSVLIFIFPLLSLNAQLCTGSLGDPIVKFTFGYDTLGFGLPPAPLASGITNYPFVANSCPLDGFYTISDFTANCFGNTWYSLPEDHTPNDTYGYMMLVNASNTPGDFYTQPVSGLCSGTTYEFAAWLLNLNVPTACGGTPTKPNITFNIETPAGSILKSYNTGDISVTPFATWRQYGTFFTTPAGVTDVVIRMTNNAPGGCGNDIALDDITFRPCGATVTASINGSSTTQNVCAGNVSANTFTGNIPSPGPTTAYQWQISTDNGVTWTDIAGATSTSYIPTVSVTGSYQYRLTVADAPGTPSTCRTLSNVLFFNVDNSPVAPAFTAADTTCISNQPVVFTEQPQNPVGTVVEWNWNFGDLTPIVTATTNAAQSHTYAAAGNYTATLQVKNATGCTSVAFSKQVVISNAPTVDFSFTNSCQNNPVNFTSITNAGSGASYLWTFGDATTSTATNPVKTYTSGTSFLVTLQITSFFGCSSSITKTITLTTKPITPSFTAPATGCINQTITFTDQPTNPAGTITQWIWNFGDGSPVVTAVTNVAQTHTYTTIGTYTVTILVNKNGCLSNVFQKQIVISNAPTVDFSFTSSCKGLPINFTSITNAGAGAQYSWAFGDATTSSDANPVKIYMNDGTYNVLLTIISAAGCSSNISHPVIIIPLLSTPIVTLDSTSSNFLKFKWLPVSGAIGYKVSIDGGTTFTDPSSGSTGTTHSIANLTPGQSITIIVKALGANGCENSAATATGNTTTSNLDVFIPNTFTPNGDGKNDVLKIYGNNVKGVIIKIFNQWGELIFVTVDKNSGWNGTYKGKNQPVGVYIYAATVTLDNGQVINKKGTINLVK